MTSHERRAPVVIAAGGAGNCLNRGDGGVSSSGGCCYSHDSEPDLAAMVNDFLESSSSAGAESRYSSDNDSGFSDLALLADTISVDT